MTVTVTVTVKVKVTATVVTVTSLSRISFIGRIQVQVESSLPVAGAPSDSEPESGPPRRPRSSPGRPDSVTPGALLAPAPRPGPPHRTVTVSGIMIIMAIGLRPSQSLAARPGNRRHGGPARLTLDRAAGRFH